MKTLEISERYTKAIFQLAEEQGSTEQVYEILKNVQDVVTNQPQILTLFQNPIITRNEKKSLTEGILGSHSDSLAKRFLNLLVEKNRMTLLPEVLERFEAFLDEKKGIVRTTVITARPLSQYSADLIHKTLERISKKKVVCKMETEPELLGGIQIRIGNRLIDDSLRTKLNELKHQLETIKVI